MRRENRGPAAARALAYVLLALVVGLFAQAAAYAAEAAPAGTELSYLVRDEAGAWAGSWTHDARSIAPEARATGVRIVLPESEDAAYDVLYRAQTSDGTWLGWCRDGQGLVSPAGSTLATVQVGIVAAGDSMPFDDGIDTVSNAPGTDDLTTPLSAQATVGWKRLDGANRYQTMAKIVEEGFAGKSDWVVVASAKTFPDALSACALAGAHNCPLVITDPAVLTVEAKAQVKRLAAKHAILMGGEAAVGPGVEDELKGLSVEVTRVAGENREQTSVEAFKELRATTKSSHTVIIASGSTYYDALSIAPWAFATRSPIVLVGSRGTLSDQAANAIADDTGITDVVVVGGLSVVKPEVESQIGRSLKYRRLAGKDRFATSRDIAEWEVKSQGFSWAKPAVASARDFPDALTGGALCGKNKSPLLLAASFGDDTLKSLRANASSVSAGYLLGGKSAVPFDNPLLDLGDPMVAKAQTYTSSTGWLILVDCTQNRLMVFTGSVGNWAPHDSWAVATGKPDTPTIKGVHYVGSRGYSFGDSDHTCYWWTEIYGPYLFHSVLYYPGTMNVKDGRVGLNLSMGCVRNPIERAKWIYDTIPSGTTVVTY